MINSDSRDERKAAANKFMMYYAHLRDLEREVPSTAIVEWWEDLQKDLREIIGPTILQVGEKDATKNVKEKMDSLLKHHADRVKSIFAGQKGEVFVVSSFQMRPQPAKTFPGQVVNYSIFTMLRAVSTEMFELYGLERLDVPQQLCSSDTPIK